MIQGMRKTCGRTAMSLEAFLKPIQNARHYASANSTSADQNLPHLPVPKLNDTLAKYLKTVRPHLDEKEFEITTKVVEDFSTGIGNKLQSLLEKRAEKHTNWLEEWWLNTAYLEYRDPVVVYSSPGLVFPFRKFQNQTEQLKYAAETLVAAMKYKLLIDNSKIPVDMMGKNPLDMSQYKKIFGTCRIPALKRDKLSFNNTKYITVIHNNNIFHVDLWGDDDVMLNEEQIMQQLQKVIELSKSSADPIGILTSEHRDNWAKAYDILKKDSVNKASLEDIERSLVVLSLDAASGLWEGTDKNARQNIAAAQTIHGGGSRSNGGNRWFDKTVQFIVGADGVTGLTYEHSPAEGQPIAVLTDFIIDYIEKPKETGKPSSCVKNPIKLEFNVNPEISSMIKTAQDNLDKLANNLELDCFTFDRYGKNFIKSQKLSPDSYLQMAMQYAFYRLHGRAGAHYESAATRMYLGGRTETIRSCSQEAVQFARAMLQPEEPRARLAALRQAVDAHKHYTVQALQGYGVDRHLLGLKLIAIENGMEIPKLYSDAGFVKSSHMRISTSQVACKCDGFMCYGPLVSDGYATCYNPRDADVNFATSAFLDGDSSLAGYRDALEASLVDMHDLLLQTTQSKL